MGTSVKKRITSSKGKKNRSNVVKNEKRIKKNISILNNIKSENTHSKD